MIIVQRFQSWSGAIGQVPIRGVGGFLPRQLHFSRFYRHGDSRYSPPGVEGQVVRHDSGEQDGSNIRVKRSMYHYPTLISHC